jgi:isoleucyl-tRNA synthetase
VTPQLYDALAALGDNLREALVVSQLELVRHADESIEEVRFQIEPALGEKCARCWKFRELGTDPEHPALCSDCAQVVRGLDARVSS